MIQVPSYAQTAVGMSAVECLGIVVYTSTDKASEVPFHIRDFFAQVTGRPVSCICLIHGNQSIRIHIQNSCGSHLDHSDEDVIDHPS